MSVTEFFIGEGDKPNFQRVLEDADGVPVDIEDATVHLTLTPMDGGAAAVDADIVNMQLGNGIGDNSVGLVGRPPAQWTETLAPGVLLGKIAVTFQNGQQQTFPNDGFFYFIVTPQASSQQRRYLSAAELKDTLGLEDETFADRDIEVAIEAASRGLEERYDMRWTKGATDTEQRYYTADTDLTVPLGDVLEVGSIDIDYTIGDIYTDEPTATNDWDYIGGGTYSTPLVSTDYRLLPIQSGLIANGGNGEPFRSLQLRRGGRYRRLPRGIDAIRVTGRFGWETVPAGVKSSVSIIATRLLRRSREAPWGIIAVGLEGQIVRAREITRDPEITFAMSAVTGARSWVV